MKQSIYLSRRNPKVKCLTFSLPHRKTCPGSTPACCAICYAKVAEDFYKEVLPSRTRNLIASKQDDFVDQMVATLSKRRKRVLRVHESGDFYSQAYVEKWAEIALRLPDFRFYAYTRSWMFDFSCMPENFVLRYSVDCTTKHTIEGMPLALAATECPASGFVTCPGSAGGDVKCIRDCSLCIDSDANIYFHAHGTHRKKLIPFEQEVRKAA